MDILKFIKSIGILLLVGSSIVFANPVVRQSVETVEQTSSSDIINVDVDFKEIMMWMFILSCLGVAIYVLVFTLASFSKLDELDFLNTVMNQSNTYSLT